MVSDCSKPRLCHLLLRSYFPVNPVRPSHRQTSLQRRVWLLPCPSTPTLLPQHRIIHPPECPPSPSHNNALILSLHRFLCSHERRPSPMPMTRLLPSLCCCPLPADIPSRHTSWITITSAPVHPAKYILMWRSIGHPWPPRGLSPPATRITCLLLHAEFEYMPEGHPLFHLRLEPVDVFPYILHPCHLQHFLILFLPPRLIHLPICPFPCYLLQKPYTDPRYPLLHGR